MPCRLPDISDSVGHFVPKQGNAICDLQHPTERNRERGFRALPTHCRRWRGLLMDYDAATFESLRVRGVDVVACALHVVVDHGAGSLVYDLDPEFVDTAAAADVPVSRGQKESVVAAAVDGSRPLVLR